MLLLVEDEPCVREELAELLELRGFPVTQASCVQEALAILPTLAAHAALLTDMRLPDGSGMDLIRAICADDATRRRIRFMVLMTGHTDLTDQVRRDADRLGVPLLFKPLPIASLLPLLGTPAPYS